MHWGKGRGKGGYWRPERGVGVMGFFFFTLILFSLSFFLLLLWGFRRWGGGLVLWYSFFFLFLSFLRFLSLQLLLYYYSICGRFLSWFFKSKQKVRGGLVEREAWTWLGWVGWACVDGPETPGGSSYRLRG